MKTKFLEIILSIALILVVVTSFAHTWQQGTTLTSAGATAMSADGRIICVVNSSNHPFISTDSGKTWALAMNSPPWGSYHLGTVAISADGGKILAALATNTTTKTWMFVSSDQGANWEKTGFPVTTTATNYYVACSADGTKVITSLGNGPIFYSTNGGVNCYTSSVPNGGYLLASSADGTRMIAAAGALGLYFSSDFGVNWISQNLPLSGFVSLCTSSDGKTIGLTGISTIISTDSGVTWRTNTLGGQTIACSAQGSDWIVAGNQIYTSIDSPDVGDQFGKCPMARRCRIGRWLRNGSGRQWPGNLDWSARANPSIRHATPRSKRHAFLAPAFHKFRPATKR